MVSRSDDVHYDESATTYRRRSGVGTEGWIPTESREYRAQAAVAPVPTRIAATPRSPASGPNAPPVNRSGPPCSMPTRLVVVEPLIGNPYRFPSKKVDPPLAVEPESEVAKPPAVDEAGSEIDRDRGER